MSRDISPPGVIPLRRYARPEMPRSAWFLVPTKFGGERGIRTLEGLLTLTPLAGVRLRPLGHLSASSEKDETSKTCKPRRALPARIARAAMILNGPGKRKHAAQGPASQARCRGSAWCGRNRASRDRNVRRGRRGPSRVARRTLRAIRHFGQAVTNSAAGLDSPCDSPCCSRLIRS